MLETAPAELVLHVVITTASEILSEHGLEINTTEVPAEAFEALIGADETKH
jgi:hypothetical protein